MNSHTPLLLSSTLILLVIIVSFLVTRYEKYITSFWLFALFLLALACSTSAVVSLIYIHFFR